MNRVLLACLGFSLGLISVGCGLTRGSSFNLGIGVPGALLNGIILLSYAVTHARPTGEAAERSLLVALILSALGTLITFLFAVCMVWNLFEMADRFGLLAAVVFQGVALGILACFVELFSQLRRARVDGEPAG